MALSPAAYIPPGCSPQCAKSVIARPDRFAYASIQGISMYHMETRSVPNLADAAAAAAAAAASPVLNVPSYRLQTLYGVGLNGTLSAFDYNAEMMAGLCALTKSVVVWRLSDAEALPAKVPPSLHDVFKKEGSPSTLCVAGRYHLIFGTTSGRLVSLNTSDGPHEPHVTAVMPASPPPSATPLKSPSSTPFSPIAGASAFSAASLAALAAASSTGSAGTVESVECVAVSPSKPDVVACGTADGTCGFFTLNASTGLTATGSLVAFPPPSKEKERLLAPYALPVTVMTFHPTNANQLVVGSREGGLALCDVSNPAAVSAALVFDCKEKISSITFIPGDDSGAFYTTSASSNVVRKWTTASRSCVMSFAPVEESLGIRCASCMDADRVVLACTNGAVKVYNVTVAAAGPPAAEGQRPTELATVAGHTDVVLTCRLAPHDRDLIASAGADGSIRVWNLRTMALQYSIDVGPVMIYAVDWSTNGRYLVAALGSGEVVQYHCATQRQGWRTAVFADFVYRVQWSSAGDASVIVATSRSGVALLSKEGQVVRRLASPGGAVYGVDVEPSKGKTLAIGCNDHRVYVYNLSSNSDAPVLTLSGHNDVVSDVTYNPSAPQFLLSSSYDGTCRVWDLSSNDSHTISVNARPLKGHADRVKCVAWCSVAPYLALSGGCDATVRLWDIRNGVCVTAVRGGNSDVCAIATHADRPLVFISAHKGGSLVAWQLFLLRQVYHDAALGTLEQCIVPDAASLMSVATGGSVSVSVVSGAAVQKLAAELRDASAVKPTERFEKLVGFFEFPQGTAELAQLASYAVDPASYTPAASGAASAGYGGALLVVPAAKLADYRRARAKQLAEKAHGKTVTSAGVEYKKRRLLEAADEQLRVGQFREACELLCEADDWERAVALAPTISRAYWRELCLKAATAMEAAGSPRAVAYYIMAEESVKAAAVMARLSTDTPDAAVVVSRTCPQRAPGNSDDAEYARQANTDLDGLSAAAKSTEAARAVALTQHHSARVLSAAYLANGQNDAAVRVLANTGDVSLAHLLVHTVPLREQQSIDRAFELSMQLSARLRQWDVAVLCATRHSNPYHSLATLLSLFQFTHGKQASRVPTQSMTSAGLANFQAINDKLKTFYEQVKGECAKLQLPMDAAAIQQRHANDGLASQNQIAAMVLAADPTVGPVTSPQVLQSIHGFVESLLNVALQDADGPNAGFYLRQAYNVIGYVALPISLPSRGSALGTSTHGMHTSANLAGSSAAAPSGSSSNAPPPTSSSPLLASTSSASSGLSAEHKKFLCLVYLVASLMCVKVYQLPTMLNTAFEKARELGQVDGALSGLVTKVQAALRTYSPHSVPVDCAPLGACLPAIGNDGKQLSSAVTSQPMTGPLHILEDSTSLMSREEALAWSLCCPFSPLATGARVSVL